MRHADGGYPELNCFRVQSDPENTFCVDLLYSLANPAVGSVKEAIAAWQATLGACTLPIGRDGGGNPFYLDLSGDPSSIWIYLHDEQGKRVKLAGSLDDFLAGLTVDPDFI